MMDYDLGGWMIGCDFFDVPVGRIANRPSGIYAFANCAASSPGVLTG
jgi:hypothetical protein